MIFALRQHRTRPHRRIGVLASLLAIVGQLLLPSWHAQAWATQNDAPVLVAFCGTLSTTQTEAWLASLPAELRSVPVDAHEHATFQGCALCALVHAIGASPGSSPVQHALAAMPGIAPMGHRVAAPDTRDVAQPSQRGPPRLS